MSELKYLYDLWDKTICKKHNDSWGDRILEQEKTLTQESQS